MHVSFWGLWLFVCAILCLGTIDRQVRQRVVDKIDGRRGVRRGDSAAIACRAVGRVGRTTAFRWMLQRNQIGQYDPIRVRHDQRQVNVAHLDFLLQTLLDEPRLYLIEMVGVIAEEFSVAYTRKQIQRALRSRGWTRKKLERHAREQDAMLRAIFRETIASYAPETLLFIDETHCDRKTYRRKYGYSRRGTPAWKRLSF